MPGGQVGTYPVASYQVVEMPAWAGWATVAGSLSMSIYAAAVTLLRAVGPMRFSGLAVLIVMAACMYQMAFVWVRRVDLTANEIVWQSLARHGRIPLDDLARIRNDVRRPGQALFEGRHGACVRIAANERMSGFLTAVRKRAPHADVSVQLYVTRGRGRLG